MVTKFPAFSKALSNDPTTRRLFFGIAIVHDFEFYDGITEEFLYQKVFVFYFG
jgi:photosystem I P700 chlorophyll a apoprotein A2